MNNHLVQRYFKQYQELYGNTIYINDIKKASFNIFGSTNSRYVFIKKFSNDKNEINTFYKILNALNMSEDNTLVIDCIGIEHQKNDKLISYLNKLTLNNIIIMGKELSQNILKTKDNIKQMSEKDNFLNKTKVIPTYSLKDVISNTDLKRSLWNDIKFLRNHE